MHDEAGQPAVVGDGVARAEVQAEGEGGVGGHCAAGRLHAEDAVPVYARIKLVLSLHGRGVGQLCGAHRLLALCHAAKVQHGRAQGHQGSCRRSTAIRLNLILFCSILQINSLK